jgi:hypothetical protein
MRKAAAKQAIGPPEIDISPLRAICNLPDADLGSDEGMGTTADADEEGRRLQQEPNATTGAGRVGANGKDDLMRGRARSVSSRKTESPKL